MGWPIFRGRIGHRECSRQSSSTSRLPILPILVEDHLPSDDEEASRFVRTLTRAPEAVCITSHVLMVLQLCSG